MKNLRGAKLNKAEAFKAYLGVMNYVRAATRKLNEHDLEVEGYPTDQSITMDEYFAAQYWEIWHDDEMAGRKLMREWGMKFGPKEEIPHG